MERMYASPNYLPVTTVTEGSETSTQVGATRRQLNLAEEREGGDGDRGRRSTLLLAQQATTESTLSARSEVSVVLAPWCESCCSVVRLHIRLPVNHKLTYP